MVFIEDLEMRNSTKMVQSGGGMTIHLISRPTLMLLTGSVLEMKLGVASMSQRRFKE